MKSAYSAWSKMRRKQVTLTELHDVLGLRIIFKPSQSGRLPTPHHWQRQAILCYRALEVVHRVYPPLLGRRIKDYVACPKQNGYQSLHSSVRLGSLRSEIQVRTTEMHRFAEFGKASHWLYKSEESDGLDDWLAAAERSRRRQQQKGSQRGGQKGAQPSRGKAQPQAARLQGGPPAAQAAQAALSRAGGRVGAGGGRGRVGGGGEPAGAGGAEEGGLGVASRGGGAPGGGAPGPFGGAPGLFNGSAAGFSQLEDMRRSLRERKVYALVRSGDGGDGGSQVLALQAGARLEDALRVLRARRSGGESLAPLATATVNGRTVRRGYRIQHGDVLALVPSARLNSATWLEGGGTSWRDADEGGGATGGLGDAPGRGGGGGGRFGGRRGADSSSIPWPWSLIDDPASSSSGEWYREAEVKHSAIAVLALANWLLLWALGETSPAAEPLSSPSTPLGAIAWGSQFSAVALLEASVLHVSTSQAIARLAREGMDEEDEGEEGAADWRSLPRWLRFLPPADDPASVAVYALSERLRPLSLWLGRVSMLSLAALALRADASSGLLHEFLERPGQPPAAELLREAREGERGEEASGPFDAAASMYSDAAIEPLAMGVVMQDVWPD